MLRLCAAISLLGSLLRGGRIFKLAPTAFCLVTPLNHPNASIKTVAQLGINQAGAAPNHNGATEQHQTTTVPQNSTKPQRCHRTAPNDNGAAEQLDDHDVLTTMVFSWQLLALSALVLLLCPTPAWPCR